MPRRRFAGVGAASGPMIMGALGKGFGFNIGSGPKGDLHGSGAGFAIMEIPERKYPLRPLRPEMC